MFSLIFFINEKNILQAYVSIIELDALMYASKSKRLVSKLWIIYKIFDDQMD